MLSKKEQLKKSPKKPRTRKCLTCRQWFLPLEEGITTCSTDCAIMHGKTNITKQNQKEQRKAKSELNQKDKKFLAKQARYYCHKYILLRDKGKPCISCQQFANRYEAGHYMSSGNNAHIKFDEANIHAQCHKCNCYMSANLIPYRVNLIEKIGIDEVERLEQKKTKIYSVQELRDIIEMYKQKIKALDE